MSKKDFRRKTYRNIEEWEDEVDHMDRRARKQKPRKAKLREGYDSDLQDPQEFFDEYYGKVRS